MTVQLATEQDRDEWNQFVVTAPGGSFLQSWEWGDVQRAFGLVAWRIVAREQGQLAGAALVVSRSLPSGQKWLYAPRGPVTKNDQFPMTNSQLMKDVVKLAREQRALFVRIEPAEVPGAGWRKAVRDVQPRHTLVVDLHHPAEKLLAGMHQKTRYNIRLAEKRGVQIRFSTSDGDIESFLLLTREVADRGAFRFHPDDYYRSLLRVLSRSLRHPSTGGADGGGGATAEVALAEHDGDILAAHILVSFGDTVTYVHGASSSRKRDLMAPHLLQWASLARAKERGYAHYDFFGVAPPSAPPTHPWVGITRFKESFGGRRVDYAGAYDLVLNQPVYWLYTFAHKLKR